eukprot:CFRG6252T1
MSKKGAVQSPAFHRINKISCSTCSSNIGPAPLVRRFYCLVCKTYFCNPCYQKNGHEHECSSNKLMLARNHNVRSVGNLPNGTDTKPHSRIIAAIARRRTDEYKRKVLEMVKNLLSKKLKTDLDASFRVHREKLIKAQKTINDLHKAKSKKGEKVNYRVRDEDIDVNFRIAVETSVRLAQEMLLPGTESILLRIKNGKADFHTKEKDGERSATDGTNTSTKKSANTNKKGTQGSSMENSIQPPPTKESTRNRRGKNGKTEVAMVFEPIRKRQRVIVDQDLVERAMKATACLGRNGNVDEEIDADVIAGVVMGIEPPFMSEVISPPQVPTTRNKFIPVMRVAHSLHGDGGGVRTGVATEMNTKRIMSRKKKGKDKVGKSSNTFKFKNLVAVDRQRGDKKSSKNATPKRTKTSAKSTKASKAHVSVKQQVQTHTQQHLKKDIADAHTANEAYIQHQQYGQQEPIQTPPQTAALLDEMFVNGENTLRTMGESTPGVIPRTYVKSEYMANGMTFPPSSMVSRDPQTAHEARLMYATQEQDLLISQHNSQNKPQNEQSLIATLVSSSRPTATDDMRSQSSQSHNINNIGPPTQTQLDYGSIQRQPHMTEQQYGHIHDDVESENTKMRMIERGPSRIHGGANGSMSRHHVHTQQKMQQQQMRQRERAEQYHSDRNEGQRLEVNAHLRDVNDNASASIRYVHDSMNLRASRDEHNVEKDELNDGANTREEREREIEIELAVREAHQQKLAIVRERKQQDMRIQRQQAKMMEQNASERDLLMTDENVRDVESVRRRQIQQQDFHSVQHPGRDQTRIRHEHVRVNDAQKERERQLREREMQSAMENPHIRTAISRESVANDGQFQSTNAHTNVTGNGGDMDVRRRVSTSMSYGYGQGPPSHRQEKRYVPNEFELHNQSSFPKENFQRMPSNDPRSEKANDAYVTVKDRTYRELDGELEMRGAGAGGDHDDSLTRRYSFQPHSHGERERDEYPTHNSMNIGNPRWRQARTSGDVHDTDAQKAFSAAFSQRNTCAREDGSGSYVQRQSIIPSHGSAQVMRDRTESDVYDNTDCSRSPGMRSIRGGKGRRDEVIGGETQGEGRRTYQDDGHLDRYVGKADQYGYPRYTRTSDGGDGVLSGGGHGRDGYADIRENSAHAHQAAIVQRERRHSARGRDPMAFRDREGPGGGAGISYRAMPEQYGHEVSYGASGPQQHAPPTSPVSREASFYEPSMGQQRGIVDMDRHRIYDDGQTPLNSSSGYSEYSIRRNGGENTFRGKPSQYRAHGTHYDREQIEL